LPVIVPLANCNFSPPRNRHEVGAACRCTVAKGAIIGLPDNNESGAISGHNRVTVAHDMMIDVYARDPTAESDLYYVQTDSAGNVCRANPLFCVMGFVYGDGIVKNSCHYEG
jgi:hypothetical protein